MNDKHIRRYTLDNLPAGKIDWAHVDSLSDEQIDAAIRDDPDAARELDDAFWRNATRVPAGKFEDFVRRQMSEQTEPVALDRDVVDWFRQKGEGYQRRINAALRNYMKARSR